MKCAKDIVGGQDLVTISGEALVIDAARAMTARNIGAVPVLEDGRVVGIFTERDALNRVVAAGLHPERTRVADVMSRDLVTAHPGETCDACLNRMSNAHIRHLLVLDGNRVAGIVSMRDLMAIDLDDKLETITQLNAYVHSIPTGL